MQAHSLTELNNIIAINIHLLFLFVFLNICNTLRKMSCDSSLRPHKGDNKEVIPSF